MAIRTIQCTNGETCFAEECVVCGCCAHADEAAVLAAARDEYYADVIRDPTSASEPDYDVPF